MRCGHVSAGGLYLGAGLIAARPAILGACVGPDLDHSVTVSVEGTFVLRFEGGPANAPLRSVIREVGSRATLPAGATGHRVEQIPASGVWLTGLLHVQ